MLDITEVDGSRPTVDAVVWELLAAVTMSKELDLDIDGWIVTDKLNVWVIERSGVVATAWKEL